MEIQQAKEKTRQREREFRLAFDTIPTLAWSALPDGRIEFFNKQWHDYTGLSPEEGFLEGWKSSIHPMDLERLVENWDAIRASGTSGEMEARVRGFEGEYRWFLIRAKPLYNDSGEIIRWYGTNTDIEDRKQAEALLAGEKRLLELIATGHSLPAILDTLCRLVEELAPGSLASILLLDPDTKRLRHGAAPSLPATYTNAIDGSLISPSAGSCGTAAYRRERVFVSDIATDPLWADYCALALAHDLRACWSTPILSSEGEVLGTFAIYAREAREITPKEVNITEQFTHLASIVVERKRAEDALKKGEAFLAEGQRISRTGSWSWTLSTGKVVWSEESYRIFGFRPAEVTPTLQLFVDRVHPKDLTFVQQILAEAIREGRDFSFEYRIVVPDGSTKHLQSVGRHIARESGEVDEYIGTTMDITDRKRAEEDLRRSEASLRKAQGELAHVTRTATLGELVASIAHEVSQPVAGILMNGNASLRWMAADSPNLNEAREAMLRVIRDGKRAGEVIGRIRNLVKKVESVKERLDINEAIHEIVVLARNEMRKSRIVLQLNLGDDLPPVLGDRVQLQQVMMNLILNALEAMNMAEHEPRTLVIRTRNIEDNQVCVEVRDSGIGIAPSDAERIFDSFKTTKAGGLGMGLAISRSIIEGHGGRLRVVPQDGPGATFQFNLLSCGQESSA